MTVTHLLHESFENRYFKASDAQPLCQALQEVKVQVAGRSMQSKTKEASTQSPRNIVFESTIAFLVGDLWNNLSNAISNTPQDRSCDHLGRNWTRL